MCKLYENCLIGLGPAGIGFISSLKEEDLKNTICFEKGSGETTCTCHTSLKCSNCTLCNIVSGIGGASRFSCGKISNYPAGSGLLQFWNSEEFNLVNFLNSNINILKQELELRKVNVSLKSKTNAKTLFEANGISYKYYDVYEFEKEKYLSYLFKTINEAQKYGIQINYNSEVLNIEKSIYQKKSVYAITVKEKNGISKYYAQKIIIATGNIHDNAELMQTLLDRVSQTFYELGIRITVPTDKLSHVLDAHGDLKLKYNDGRTYCVSKNGFIIAYSINNSLLLEGYVDNSSSSNLTNLAIIIKSDDYNELKTFKETYTGKFSGIPIKQLYTDYKNNQESLLDLTEKYLPVQKGNIRNLFSNKLNSHIVDFIDTVLIRTIGIDQKDIIIYAPELKETISFEINNDFRVADNVFVIGSATGKFRGILQSLCSGMHCADIIRR